MDISFIILTWNSARYIPKCFDTVIDKCLDEKISFEILAIDNGSIDNTPQIIEAYKKKKSVSLTAIFFDSNRGTTFSRNVALKQAKGEIICILDSDTELVKGSLREVINLLSKESTVGLLAPKLILPDGTVQNSVKRFPTFIGKLIKIPKIVLKLPTVDFDFYKEICFDEIQEVDTAISACWFFKKKILNHIGFLDNKIFYSPEDLDYCLRLKKGGFKVIFWPEFIVAHHTQQISHRNPFSKMSLSHLKGLIYYFHKHGGWFSTNRLYQK